MAEVENLQIIIDVLGDWSVELNQLIVKLAEVRTVAEAVDNIRIDVDVHDRDLDVLMAKMAAASGGGAVAGGVTRGRGGGGGGMGGVSRSIDRAADAMEDMADSGGILDLRMSDVHNALAKLVPLLLVIIGALPALIGGLVVLASAALAAAAALTAFTAIGALGVAIQRGGVDNLMEGFQDIAREVADDFIDAFAPLAERLAPMFEDALDGLDRLFEAVAQRGDSLVELADVARDFGGFLLSFIPDMLEAWARFADAMAPVFGMIGDFLQDTSLTRGMAAFFADALPSLAEFTSALIDIIPLVLDFSIGMLRITSVMTRFLELLFEAISLGGAFSEEVGFMIGLLFALWTTLSVGHAIIGTQFVAAIVSAIKSLQAFVGMLLLTQGAAGATAAAINAIKIAVAGFFGIGLALVALGSVASMLADHFSRTSSSIDDATSSLRSFKSEMRGLRSGENPFGVDLATARQAAGRGGGNTIIVNGAEDPQQTRTEVERALNGLRRPR